MYCILIKASIWGQLFMAQLEGPVWAVTSHLDVPAAGLLSPDNCPPEANSEPLLVALGTNNPTLPLCLEKQFLGWFEGKIHC